MSSGATMDRRELFTRWFDGDPAQPPVRPPTPDASALADYLRPPGAAPESELIAICERCHRCAEACPHDAILPLGPAYGAAEGTPAILPRGAPCRLCEGLPCAAACPSGALRALPLDQVRLGLARLDATRCWAAQGQPCDYCVKECPLGEAALRWNGDRPEIVDDGCNGCGQCVHICTATPPALRIERRG